MTTIYSTKDRLGRWHYFRKYDLKYHRISKSTYEFELNRASDYDVIHRDNYSTMVEIWS